MAAELRPILLARTRESGRRSDGYGIATLVKLTVGTKPTFS